MADIWEVALNIEERSKLRKVLKTVRPKSIESVMKLERAKAAVEKGEVFEAPDGSSPERIDAMKAEYEAKKAAAKPAWVLLTHENVEYILDSATALLADNNVDGEVVRGDFQMALAPVYKRLTAAKDGKSIEDEVRKHELQVIEGGKGNGSGKARPGPKPKKPTAVPPEPTGGGTA